MEVLPSNLHYYIDTIAHAQDGTLGIGSSTLTGRTWNGSIWIFKEPSKAPDPHYCSGRASSESGITDLQWLDSKRMIVASDSGAIDIWAQSGSLPGLENLASFDEHDDIASSVSIDCGKGKIVSGSWDKSIKLWDLNSEQCVHTYKGHGDSILGVDCSRTEKDLFLSASKDGSVVLWDTRKSSPAKHLADPTQYHSVPCCLDWSPLDSSIFATGFEDGTIHLYSIKETKIIFSYSPHSRPVNRVAFSPRSPEWLASVSDDTLVHVQDVLNNSTVLRSDSHTDFVRGLSWSPLDDSLLTSGWDRAIITHMCGIKQSSDLAVEASKSQATSIISLDTDGQLQIHMNGDLDDDEEETMDVEQVNEQKLAESKMENGANQEQS